MIKYCTSDFKTALTNIFFSNDLRLNCSSDGIIIIPSDPSNETITKKYGDEIINVFRNLGIEFKNIMYIFKSEDIEIAYSKLNNYSCIFLMGGNTKIQNVFLKSINFVDFLNSFQGILIGQSAGALNICNLAYLSPCCNVGAEVEFIDGLNIVDDMFEVHFELSNDEQKRFIENTSLNMFCITDNGVIKYHEDNREFWGEVYEYRNGEYIML